MKRLLGIIFALTFVAAPALACDHFVRAYGAAATVDFNLWLPDGTAFYTSTAPDGTAANEVMVSVNEGTQDECGGGSGSACITDEGTFYSMALTQTEMTAARVNVTIRDQAGAAFLDKCLVIDTYGNASAQFPTADANVVSVDPGAIPNILYTGTLQSGGAIGTRSVVLASATPSTVDLKGMMFVTTGGAGTGQARRIITHAGSTDTITLDKGWKTATDNTTTYAVVAGTQVGAVLEPYGR